MDDAGPPRRRGGRLLPPTPIRSLGRQGDTDMSLPCMTRIADSLTGPARAQMPTIKQDMGIYFKSKQERKISASTSAHRPSQCGYPPFPSQCLKSNRRPNVPACRVKNKTPTPKIPLERAEATGKQGETLKSTGRRAL